MEISEVRVDEYPFIFAIWESSVRATHHFLSEEDIQFLKPIVHNEAIPNLELRCVRNEHDVILGFVGVAEDAVEMLFVSPKHFGEGIGIKLMVWAEQEFGTSKVDVNEQNPNALAFYKKLGYKQVGRSELDGQGKPFPILHLQLERT